MSAELRAHVRSVRVVRHSPDAATVRQISKPTTAATWSRSNAPSPTPSTANAEPYLEQVIHDPARLR